MYKTKHQEKNPNNNWAMELNEKFSKQNYFS